MDDGIELNFSAPATAVVRQVSGGKKGGRWTDRVKAKRAVRDQVKQSPNGSTQRSSAPAETWNKAPVEAVNQALNAVKAAPRPATKPPTPVFKGEATSAFSSRPATTVRSNGIQPRVTSSSASSARTAMEATASPRQRTASKPPLSNRLPPASSAAQSQNAAGPSRLPAQSAPSHSTGPQIISSLFSSNPNSLPKPPKSAATQVLGAPSNAPVDTSSFQGLGLDPLLVRHLKGKMKVDRPTAIQRSALPYMLSAPLNIDRAVYDEDEDEDEGGEGAAGTGSSGKKENIDESLLRDIFIQSQTGSGKTLTYLLPIIQTLLPLSRLSYIDRSIGTLAIILAPTRELAQQISKVLEQILSMSLSQETDDDSDQVISQQYARWLVSGLLTGGSTRTHEKARLRKGVPILVSTPGRLLDHLQNTSSFKCAKTLFLVLDEADRLMDLGFEETIQGIIKALEGRRKIEISAEKEMDEEGGGTMRWDFWARGRRTILCSATVDGKVEKLSGTTLKNPIVFRGASQGSDPKSKGGASDTAGEGLSEGKEKNVDKKVELALADASAIVLPSLGEDKFTPPSQLSQKYIVAPTKLRLVSLVSLLRSLISAAAKVDGNGTKIIVFLSSTDAVDFHWNLLGGVSMGGGAQEAAPAAKITETAANEADETETVEGEAIGSPAKADKATKDRLAKTDSEAISLSSSLFPNTSLHRLHGSLPLRTRLASLKAFATPSPTHSILFATSVASRGLDLPLVRAVVQYDLPTEGGANEYVHRVGRTARAGKGGEAWAFVGPSEVDWIPWVEEKMGSVEGKGVKLSQVGVEEVLKKGFGGKGWEYEQRATDVQLSFERWVLASNDNASMARKAFSSYIRAYSTHPLEEKKFFHTRSLHLGHLAKSFALREAPGSLVSTTSAGKGKVKPSKGEDESRQRKRKRDGDDQDSEEERGGKETTARNETERRMYEAVRKAGRGYKSEGKMGQFGVGGSEFHVVGGDEVERMVGKARGRA